MKSLFQRIFLSFWLAMGLIVIAGSTLAAFVAWQRFDAAQKIEVSDIAEAASRHLNKEGVDGLRVWLRQTARYNSALRTYIIDMHGEDILGRPLTDRIKRRVERMEHLGYLAGADGAPPALMPDPLLSTPQMVGPSGGVYTMFFDRTRFSFGSGSTWVDLWLVAIAMGVSALACWWLARNITRPVALLQNSARALAAGNLETSVDQEIVQRRDELGVLARDFNQMAERIRELLASKETLLRHVSHELRSPLARLRIALSLARRDGADRTREFDRMERETERLDALIGQILRFSRLEGGAPDLEKRRVDLGYLLAEVVEDARLEARGSEKVVECDPMPQAFVMGNQDALRSAIDNVMRNALRYTPEQSRVDVSLRVAGDQAALIVRDHGRGVPDADVERIFEPFFRVADSGDRGAGSGLGLAIAARIVSLHGGKIQAHNAPDRGLVVEMSLPLTA